MPLGNLNIFDINYLRSSRSHFLLLEMLFKVWWEDLRKAVTADSTQGPLDRTAEYQEVGTSLSIFTPVSRNFTGFHTHTEWMSPPCPGWRVSNDWCINLVMKILHYFEGFELWAPNIKTLILPTCPEQKIWTVLGELAVIQKLTPTRDHLPISPHSLL